ncbi:MAG: hypothetical protein KF841_15790 [Phycisphaerae bacterium]|nr:hypothetical protein [Phycisphaerae bacterium]
MISSSGAQGIGRRACIAGALLVAAPMLLAILNCREDAQRVTQRHGSHDTAPHGGGPVIAYGNLVVAERPSETSIALSEFFFGTTPETPLGLIKPVAMAQVDGAIWICDSALRTIFRYEPHSGRFKPFDFGELVSRPVSIASTENGQLLITDAGAKAVIRFDTRGREVARYALQSDSFSPAASVEVGDAVWVSNTAAHRLEVFNAKTAQHVRSIGHRGSGRGQFGSPLGMARTPRGTVLVVDMLNDRVQELDADGSWRRYIGRPGDRVGCFGRPKDVAVGPDGTIFITDAASQRVHAFDEAGGAMAAFGGASDPVTSMKSSGRKDRTAPALSVPNGLLISDDPTLLANLEESPRKPKYVVLVAEQIRRPGIRAFGWRGFADRAADAGASRQRSTTSLVQATVENPHWSATRCDTCHTMTGPQAAPIPVADVDAGCIKCHDGIHAVAEAHPVGRPGTTNNTTVPQDWPLNEGRLGCLTCHDVRRHCDVTSTRPARNSAMLRGSGLEGSVKFCLQCHGDAEAWRISPHQQLVANGVVREESCAYCHAATPTRPADGHRTGQPQLRAAGSSICLGCHSKHWDYFPGGHLGQAVTGRIAERLLAARAESAIDSSSSDSASTPPGAAYPLDEGRVACYTCHNPHQRGLFADNTPLGHQASLEADAAFLLRDDRQDLCRNCHGK